MEALRAVVYTDGGCRPNNGYGGSGLHGYTYTLETPKKGTGLKGWSITPCGYVKQNEEPDALVLKEYKDLLGTPADVLKFPDVTVHHYWDYSQGAPFPSTNNVTEAQALQQTLLMAIEHNITHLRILADSEYVIQGVNEWLAKWEQRDFTNREGKPIANRNQWVSIAASLKVLKERNCPVVISWVKAHNGDWGNEHADYQATLGVIASRKSHFEAEINIAPAEGYWSPKIDLHPLVTLSRWYFSTSVDHKPDDQGRYTYHFGTHGKDDDFVGKPVSDAAFGIVKVKEKLPTFEAVRRYHNHIVENGLVRVAVARTDYMSNPRIHRLLQQHGERYLTQEGIKPDSYMYLPMAKKPLQVARELSPPRTSYNLIEVMLELESFLDYYEGEKSFPNLRFNDVTSLLYETVEKAKGKTETKLLSTVTNVLKGLTVEVSHPVNDKLFPITQTFGVDLPSRNELSRLAKAHPKVTIMTWKESPYAFRTATIIDTDVGIGIWSGFYANIHLVTS